MIAIISDIHSNIHALEAVLEEIEASSPEKILCAGDVVGYCAHPNECCGHMRRLGAVAVLGNHDLGALTRGIGGMNPYAGAAALWTSERLDGPSREYLSSLPRSARSEAGAGKVMSVFHGSDSDPDEYVYEQSVERSILDRTDSWAVVLGHTHVPFVRTFDTGAVVNPGSVGQPRDGDPRASFALLDTEAGRFEIRRVGYDVESAAEDILDAGLPMMLARRLSVGR